MCEYYHRIGTLWIELSDGGLARNFKGHVTFRCDGNPGVWV